MASAYSIAAAALEQIINATFAPEGVVAVHDRLHESLGSERTAVGISPTRDVPMTGNRVTQLTTLQIRYFGKYNLQVDPTQKVDPRIITELAERLRNAIRDTPVTASGEMWFMNVEATEYPADPTGNSSRFIMAVTAWGNNQSLVESGV